MRFPEAWAARIPVHRATSAYSSRVKSIRSSGLPTLERVEDKSAIRRPYEILKLRSERHRLLEVLPKTLTEFLGELWPEVEGLFPFIA